MIGLAIFIACLSLILMIPCGIYAAYGPAGIEAKLFIGPVRFNLLKNRSSKGKKSKSKKEKTQEKSRHKGKLLDFLPILKLIFEFLSDFRKKLTIKDLRFKLILAADDPCDLSVNYGRTWATIGNIFPHLESWFRIQKRNIEIACDYTADATLVDASIDLRLPLISVLHIAIRHGVPILNKYYDITKNAKDGVVS